MAGHVQSSERRSTERSGAIDPGHERDGGELRARVHRTGARRRCGDDGQRYRPGHRPGGHPDDFDGCRYSAVSSGVSRRSRRGGSVWLRPDDAPQRTSLSFRANLSPGTIADAASADLVIEAIIEKPEPKSSLFQELATIAPRRGRFSPRTRHRSRSRLSVVLSGRPDRFIGLHFFNPVPVLPLVEIVRGLETSDRTLAASVKFVEAIGKTPIVVNDSPGFVANRILLPMINEAIFALQDGVASAAVDRRGDEARYVAPDGSAGAGRPDWSRHLPRHPGDAAPRLRG